MLISTHGLHVHCSTFDGTLTYRQSVCLHYLHYLQLFLKHLKTANYFSCVFFVVVVFLFVCFIWASSGVMGRFQNAVFEIIFILLAMVVIINSNLEGRSLSQY